MTEKKKYLVRLKRESKRTTVLVTNLATRPNCVANLNLKLTLASIPEAQLKKGS